MRTIVFRLILFYVLAITVMLAMTPWNHPGTGTGIAGSPFVSAFTAVGIPYGTSIMNLVVITAALSSSNTDLYLSTRMLFSLSKGRYAPEWLGASAKMAFLGTPWLFRREVWWQRYCLQFTRQRKHSSCSMIPVPGVSRACDIRPFPSHQTYESQTIVWSPLEFCC